MSTTSRSSSTAKHYRSVEQRRARLRPCSRFLALGSRLSLLPHCRLPIGNSPFSIAYCLLPIALFFLPACASRTGSPYAPQAEIARDSREADRLNAGAAEVIDTDAAQAEKLLRQALTADLYHGPAHNNLGVIYLKQGQLYQAASEFQWARQLMPGHPDPRLNLAFTLEQAGKADEAIATYRTALEVYPNHLQTTQALARLQLKSGKADAGTRALLEEVALRGESERWRQWARLEMARVRE